MSSLHARRTGNNPSKEPKPEKPKERATRTITNHREALRSAVRGEEKRLAQLQRYHRDYLMAGQTARARALEPRMRECENALDVARQRARNA